MSRARDTADLVGKLQKAKKAESDLAQAQYEAEQVKERLDWEQNDRPNLMKFNREDTTDGVYRGDLYEPRVGNRFDDYLGDFFTEKDHKYGDYAPFHFGILSDVKITKLANGEFETVLTNENGEQVFQRGSRRTKHQKHIENVAKANEGRPILVMMSANPVNEQPHLLQPHDFYVYDIHHDPRAITFKRHGSFQNDETIEPAFTYAAEDILVIDWEEAERYLGQAEVSKIVEEVFELGGPEGLFSEDDVQTLQGDVQRKIDRAKDREERQVAKPSLFGMVANRRRRKVGKVTRFQWVDFGFIAGVERRKFGKSDQVTLDVSPYTIQIRSSNENQPSLMFQGTKDEADTIDAKLALIGGGHEVWVCVDADDNMIDVRPASQAKQLLITDMNMAAVEFEERKQMFDEQKSVALNEKKAIEGNIERLEHVQQMAITVYEKDIQKKIDAFEREIQKDRGKVDKKREDHAKQLAPYKQEYEAVVQNLENLEVIKETLPEIEQERDYRADKYISFMDALLIKRKAEKEKRSLANVFPEIAAEWHPTANDFSPADVDFRSRKKAVFRCSEGHEWETAIVHRTAKNAGCPFCRRLQRPLQSEQKPRPKQMIETTAPNGQKQMVEPGQIYTMNTTGVSSAKQLAEQNEQPQTDSSATIIARLQADLALEREGRRADKAEGELKIVKLQMSQMQYQQQSEEERAEMLDARDYGQMLVENDAQRDKFRSQNLELKSIMEERGIGWQAPAKLGKHARQQLALRFGLEHEGPKITMELQKIGKGNRYKVYLPQYQTEAIFACFIDDIDPEQVFVGTVLHPLNKWKVHEEEVIGRMNKWDERVSIKDRLEQHTKITASMMAVGGG